MSILSNFDKLKQGAAQKTKAVSDTVRLTGLIKEEQKKQTNLLTQLGTYYYNYYSDQAEGPLKEFCSSIDESNALLLNYGEQLNRAKGTKTCPSCNSAVPLNAAFCNHCGSKIPEVKATQEGIFCVQCGATCESGQAFCVQCGCRLGGESEQAMVVEEPQFVPVEEVQKVEQEFIPQEPITYQEPEFVPQEPATTQEVDITCPDCNRVLEGNAAFCDGCGKQL